MKNIIVVLLLREFFKFLKFSRALSPTPSVLWLRSDMFRCNFREGRGHQFSRNQMTRSAARTSSNRFSFLPRPVVAGGTYLCSERVRLAVAATTTTAACVESQVSVCIRTRACVCVCVFTQSVTFEPDSL